jgi:hypothetical protein
VLVSASEHIHQQHKRRTEHRGGLILSKLSCCAALQEDALVVQMVQELGLSRWSVIGSHLPGRIGKQCRER